MIGNPSPPPAPVMITTFSPLGVGSFGMPRANSSRSRKDRARITPDEDLEALYQFACARIGFLEGERLAIVLNQARFGIEEVHMRRTAGHVEKDHPLGARRDAVEEALSPRARRVGRGQRSRYPG